MNETLTPFEELNQIRHRYYIGSASDLPVEIRVDGQTYKWRPGGRVEIADRMDYARDDRGKVKRNLAGEIVSALVPKKDNDAYSIMKRIFSEDPGFRGFDLGLFPIMNDGKDEQRSAAARASYIVTRVGRAKTVQRAWFDKMAKVRAGDLPPVQPRAVKEDLAFLAAYEAGVVDRKAFIAFDGGFDSDSRADVESYLKRVHPQFVAAGNFNGRPLIIVRDEMVAPAQVVPEKPPTAAQMVKADLDAHEEQRAAEQPALDDDGEALEGSINGDETPNPAEAVKFLRAKAEELKYNLTRAELAAMLDGDLDAMEQLAGKLAEVAARRGK